MLIINLKTYKTLRENFNLARKIEKVSKNIMIAAQPTDIYLLAKNITNPILAQHIDSIEPGRNTGYITAKSVKDAGAIGTFLNHSEHRMKINDIKKSILLCKSLKLKTIVFAKNVAEGKKIAKLKPDYIAIEPPELIAGKVSVSKMKPNLIKDAVNKIKGNVLVGAGIKDKSDIMIAKKLGAKGVIASSYVVKARDPKKLLKNWIKTNKKI